MGKSNLVSNLFLAVVSQDEKGETVVRINNDQGNVTRAAKVMVRQIIWILVLLAALRPSPGWAKGRCQEASAKAKVVWDEVKSPNRHPFYTEKNPWGVKRPGPLAVDGDALCIPDFRPPREDRPRFVPQIHRISLRTGEHEVYQLPASGQIGGLVVLDGGRLLGVLKESAPDAGGGELTFSGLQTLFSFRTDTGEYKELLKDRSFYGLTRLGDRVYVYHPASRTITKDPFLVAFSTKTGEQTGACQLDRPDSDQKCRGLRGEIDRLQRSGGTDSNPSQTQEVSYLAEDGRKQTLLRREHEGTGDFYFHALPSGEIMILYQSKNRIRARVGYEAFLLGPGGEKLGRAYLSGPWGDFEIQYEAQSRSLTRTCLDPVGPLRVYRETLGLSPWKD